MKNIQIQLFERQKSNGYETRKTGFVPVVVYGKGLKIDNCMIKSDNFSTQVLDKLGIFYHSTFVDLVFNDNIYSAIVQEVRFSPVNGSLMHIDFYVPQQSQEFVLKVPVILKNIDQNIELKGKGVLVKTNPTVKIRVTKANLVNQVTVDIAQLKKKETIHAYKIPNISFVIPSLPLVSIK